MIVVILGMSRYQELIDDIHSKRLGHACRAMVFLEDILEDAECEEVYVSGVFDQSVLKVYGRNCRFNIEESIAVFSVEHDVEAVVEAEDDAISLSSLYHRILDYYVRTLHGRIKIYSYRTYETGVEYYLGVLFDGRGFIVEGEENRVVLPGIPMCVSAHTHPGSNPYPSQADLRSIERILIDRGLGHAIVTPSRSLVLYRTAPITEKDHLLFKRVQGYSDTRVAVVELTSRTCLKIRVI